MVDNPFATSSAQITFQTPPEAVNRMFGMLQASQYMSGGALLISLLVSLACYLYLAGEHHDIARDMITRKQVRDAQISLLQHQIDALSKAAQKSDMNFGLWVDYTNELKGELVARGIKTPPNPCTANGACP